MKCPRCGLINLDTAERCDCGQSLRDGSFVAPAPQPTARAAQMQRLGCAVALIAFIAAAIARTAGSGLVRAASDLLMILAAAGFVVWLIGFLRSRRG